MNILFYFRAYIPINIIEEDSYEKDVLFYVELGEPRQLTSRTTPSTLKKNLGIPKFTEPYNDGFFKDITFFLPIIFKFEKTCFKNIYQKSIF